ncbi:MAG: hypothetical protein SO154_06005 [Prevotella sp.]|nr:hypothetical protein [Prevotella sp.]
MTRILRSLGGTVFQTAVTICSTNPETSSRVTLAALGIGFQPNLRSFGVLQSNKCNFFT